MNSCAVGRRRLMSAFADREQNKSILYPRRRLLGASPHSVGIYSHASGFHDKP